MKAAKNPVPAVEATSETPAEVAASIFLTTLRVIRARILEIEGGGVVVGAVDPANHAATLASKATQITGELRKLEKAERKALEDLTPADILTWARSQTSAARAKLVRDVDAIDNPSRRSVLG